jgi:subfamily B ATP-binding cassette protein HlyB/CyaB
MNSSPLAAGVLDSFVTLARFHGLETSDEELRRKYLFGEDGVSSTALVAVATDMGLQARWLNMRFDQLPKLAGVLPAMLLLSDGSALVLEGVSKSEASGVVALVADPSGGPGVRAALDEGQLTAIWSGKVFLLKRTVFEDPRDAPFGFAWLLRQVLFEKRIFRDIFIAATIGTVFVLAPPFMVMIVVDRILVDKAVATWIALVAILITMIVFEMLLGYLRRRMMEVAATRIDGRFQLYVMDRLLRLPMGYFETTPVGRIAGKLGKIYYIRAFLTGELFETLLDSVTLLGLIPALFILNWVLAIWVVALGLSIYLIVFVFMRPLTRLHRKYIDAEIKKNIFLIETLSGMRTIKSLVLEGRRRLGWDASVAEVVATKHAYGLYKNYPQTLAVPFERLMYAGSIMLGAAYVIFTQDTTQIVNGVSAATATGTAPVNGTSPALNPGALIAFGLLAGRTAQPLVHLAKLLENMGDIRSAVNEVASVINTPPEQQRGESGLRLPIRGDITFDDVSFRYVPGSPLALDGTSFHIPEGTIFGIMGRSGSGKTTITRLLQGLNTEYEGSIKIDGMDLREIDLHHLRTSIGVVPQENFLFSGTVRDNIGMAKPGATLAEIIRAAQLAGAEEFIEHMPRGYETVLEENASNLSGGQRQRLALARALLIDPAVLILDEATSALDAESEAIINANLLRIAQGRTIICVSHRLSMLVPSHAILVMEQGGAYDVGRHDELMHRCDIYKHMWHQQNRHLEPTLNVRPILARSSTS